jgi:AmmeMemoRadiSam system protein B
MTRNNLAIATLLLLLAASSAALFWPSSVNHGPLATSHGPVHYSTLMGREFFDRAYEQALGITGTITGTGPVSFRMQETGPVPVIQIAGGTVNHHLLAAPLDAQFFEGLAAQKPKRIILIGPDHLSRGREPITASTGTWATPYGQLKTDTRLVKDLTRWHLVNIEESPFDYEFSVGGLVPFVKRSLPDAKIATIIVKVDAPDATLDALAAALPTDKDTIVIGSVDFSHYLPSRAAEFHDITNRAVIDAFDFADFDRLEVDSPPTLRVLLKYLERRGAQQATLVANTDSAKITGQLDTPETTSYLNQYFFMGKPALLNIKTSLYIEEDGTPPTPSFQEGDKRRIVSPEDRFMRGFLSKDDGASLPKNLQKPDLAVGIVKTATATTYYLFPFTHDKTGFRLMTAEEERAYFRKNGIDSAIINELN